MEEKIISKCTELKNIIDSIGTVQTAWGLIAAGMLVLVFIICVFTFTNKVGKITKKQIRQLQKEGKYLPPTYIELDNSMESLRYFIFSYKWKHRIVRQYNHLFDGYEGKRLKKLLGINGENKLSYFAPFSELDAALSATHDQLDKLKRERNELYDKHGEIVWAIRNSTYYHIYAIEYLQILCAMMKQKNIILVGSAGNGKTSLLCRMSEIAISNKVPCILINSRDIREDCTEYFLKKLPIPSKLRNAVPIYLRLVSLALFFQRKYFYIFIDAINENDREVFTSSLSNLLITLSKYSRIRILLTCRSEYFESRYKTLFSSCPEEIYIFNLQKAEYDERATMKLIRAYMSYFNVRGPFSPEMKNKLMNSLLLTRIFFEVNKNRDESTLEFQNAEIYKLYFEKIASENKGVNLNAVVNNIAQCMFDEFQFDRILIDKLNLSTEELASLRDLLDNNLIISHSVYAGTGITEHEEEYIYFVFDELRDFCLARYVLTVDESNASTGYDLFFSNVKKLFNQRLSPVEGMIKYAYHHFRQTKRTDLCEMLLKAFGEVDVQSILDWERRGPYRQRSFSNFGFSLIFSEGEDIVPFEIDYILHCIENNSGCFWEIFWYLLRNEYSGFEPNIYLILDILAHWKDDVIPKKVLEFFFADGAVDYYPYYEKKRRVDYLTEGLDAIRKKNGVLSQALKIIVTLLAAYEPTEYRLEEYHDYVMNEDIFKQIQESDLCNPIKLLVSEFKDQMTQKPTDSDDLQMLMEILKSRGYYGE